MDHQTQCEVFIINVLISKTEGAFKPKKSFLLQQQQQKNQRMLFARNPSYIFGIFWIQKEQTVQLKMNQWNRFLSLHIWLKKNILNKKIASLYWQPSSESFRIRVRQRYLRNTRGSQVSKCSCMVWSHKPCGCAHPSTMLGVCLIASPPAGHLHTTPGSD